jgi:hypothetical protein
MKKKQEPRETVSLEELLMSNVYTQEAIVNLLEKKGILTQKEVIEEIMRLRVNEKKRKM